MAAPGMIPPDPWFIPSEMRAKYDQQFFHCKPVNGFITGDQARGLFMQSGLPVPVLAHIWALADTDADGKMDKNEFAIAMHLIQAKLRGIEVPKTLPPALRFPPAQPAAPTSYAGLTGIPPPASSGGMIPAPIPSVIPIVGVPPVRPPVVASSGMMGPPLVPPPPLVDTGKVQRSGSVGSQDSPTGVPSALQEWAVPQPSKLKYTQLFNAYDRTRTGFLTGAQARNILLQSALPQNILAQIWTLSDIDGDGRLTCEEFVVAMHLTDSVKAGDPLPTALPPELIPPSYRRKRSASIMSSGRSSSQSVSGDLVGDLSDEDKLKGMATFEDKRRENFEKGQAELERRRQALLESQRKEQEERERKEREEQEKRERIRLEQERRRQLELEKQLVKQREMEQEKEEQRRKALEQREAARREMERQRQLEWERQRRQELMSQRQREQEAVLNLKKSNKNLTFELEQVNNRINEFVQKIADTRRGVADVKAAIDEMRKSRDSKCAELVQVKQQAKEAGERLLLVQQEKLALAGRLKATQGAAATETYNAVVSSFNNKQITLHQLNATLDNVRKEVQQKAADVENNNAQLQELKEHLQELAEANRKLNAAYEEKKQRLLQMKRDAKEAKETPSIAEEEGAAPEVIKYKALYAFEARNPDELSFMPGDIILVPKNQTSEPGWLGGTLHGKTGWIPEAYVERMPEGDVEDEVAPAEDDTVRIVGTEMKRTLEGISEAPENGESVPSIPVVEDILQPSENTSFVQLQKAAGTASPVPGQGEVAPEGLQAQAMFPWRAKKENHLSFNKGDVIAIKEQQDMWWFGELDGNMGWFPKSYVKLISGPRRESEGRQSVDIPTMPEPEQTTAEPASYYVALYAYQSQEPGDLSFNQGDLIVVTKKEGDWWTGRLASDMAGQLGVFPSNYVGEAPSEALPQQPAEKRAAEAPQKEAHSNENAKTLRKPEIVAVIAPYKATGPEQLTLEKGQLIQVRKKSPSGWWEGELQVKGRKRQVGWFPASYVKTLCSSGASSTRSTPDPFLQQQRMREEFVPGEQVVALYPFAAQNEDELTFQKGQLITVLAKDDPTWWKGRLNDDGSTGMFPSNYVESTGKVLPPSAPWFATDAFEALPTAEKQRQGQIQELVVTEHTYLEDMTVAVEVFYKPLKRSGLLTDEEFHTIFVNWKELIVCNTKFLKALRVRKKMSPSGIVDTIGDILCENLPRMTPYVRFCSCQLNAAALIQHKTENDPAFKDFARRCQDGRVKGMPLSSYLLKPMQRITKYPLMIRKILEATPEDHPDHPELEEALAQAELLCSQVNEGVRETENSDRLEWMQKHVVCEGLPENIVFNSLTNCLGPRKFLHSGMLVKVKSGKELVGFLFNDFLLLTQPTKDIGRVASVFQSDKAMAATYRMYKKPIFLHRICLPITPVEGFSEETAFEIIHDQGRMALRAATTNERLLWMRKLEEASTAAREGNDKKLRQNSIRAQTAVCVGRILAVVVEGINLKGSTVSGRCTPYCEVSMGSQEHRTAVVENTCNPQWNASMQFLVKDFARDVLCLSVFNRDLFSPNDFLGRTEVNVADVYRETRDSPGPVLKRLPLHEVDTGEVVVKLDLQVFGATS